MAIGYIYVLSNRSMPRKFKVGYTQDLPEVRASQLYTTAVPEPFTIEFYELTSNVEEVESQVHMALEYARCNEDREFFQADIRSIVEIIKRHTVQPPRGYLRKPPPPPRPPPPLAECRRCGHRFDRTKGNVLCPQCGF